MPSYTHPYNATERPSAHGRVPFEIMPGRPSVVWRVVRSAVLSLILGMVGIVAIGGAVLAMGR